MANDVGVLLTNIGTPDAPTEKAVRRYLKAFLSDKRVVEIPSLLWWPILHGVILQKRPAYSAALYEKIWRPEGSPLLIYSQKIAAALQEQLHIPVVIGMRYGQPSIASGLEKLTQQGVKKILILPLYPQYSATTTASTADEVARILKTWRVLPEIRLPFDYADHPLYIAGICDSIRESALSQGQPDHLLFSFHGIPERCIKLGDPYAERCRITAQLVAEQLRLPNNSWSISFQSRLGCAKWLQPYTEQVLKSLPQQGIKYVHVICPGFAVDCLETLEEIAIRGKEQFLKQGGEKFYYIPALNDSKQQLQTLSAIIHAEWP